MVGRILQAHDLAEVAVNAAIDIGIWNNADEDAASKRIGSIMQRSFAVLAPDFGGSDHTVEFEGFHIRRETHKVRRLFAAHKGKYPIKLYYFDRQPLTQNTGCSRVYGRTVS